MPQYSYVDIDPVTKQPIQQAQQAVQTQQPQTQQVQNQQQPGFDVEKFAADSATRQMMYDIQRGSHPTQESYETARQAAYTQGMETMRQMALDKQRQQAELQRQEQMRTFEQFGPRVMNPEEIKDASGLATAHNQIMMLYHQNADIPDNHPYRTMAPIGDVAAKVAGITDPRVRLYDATRGGAVISLGRGLLQDTGQVAGKEQAQDLIKQLMPGPGDNQQMAARKTADMIQMEMNGLQGKIQALPQNVDSTPLQQQYARSYQDYAALVNQFGSDAQKNFPVASPQQLFGQNAPALQSPTIQPAGAAVKGGFSQATNDQLAAQASGQAAQPQQAVYTDIDPATKNPIGQQPPTTAVGAAAQQAGQYMGGPEVMKGERPQTGPQVDVTPAYKAAGQAAQTVGQGAQATLGFLQRLLPENWPGQTGGQFNQ